jgi:hypothetical protein
MPPCAAAQEGSESPDTRVHWIPDGNMPSDVRSLPDITGR